VWEDAAKRHDTGRRFWIADCALWNVYDARGSRIGQAATFPRTTAAMDKAPR
jgi:hypothetical protein